MLGMLYRGGEEFSSHYTSLDTTDQNYSDRHMNLRIQFLSFIDSPPRSPWAAEILDGTHMTSSYDMLREMFFTSSYVSKVSHTGLPNMGTHVLRCLSWRTSKTGLLALVKE